MATIPPSGRIPAPGARVGDYVLERALGRGGMGAVFVGRHATLGTRRAIKLMLAGARPQALERFQREARALAKVDRHPNVVAIHDAGVHDGKAFLVLEWVEGRDLERALADDPLEVARALRIGAQVADALAHVHAAGIVHRDLKPANVLLRAHDDAPVLTDFGIVRDEAEARITASHVLIGSPQFMAPEQLRGEHPRIGPPTDVFALGVLLYQALTGELPFEGDSVPALSLAVLQADPAPPSRLRRELPADVDVVVLAALEKDPARRPTAAQVAAALRAIARGEPVDLPHGASARRSWLRAPRRLRGALRAGAASLALTALALGVVHLAWLAPRARAVGALAAAHDLDARLGAWRLGLGGGDAPLAARELAQRAAALEGARARLTADEATAADGLRARLLAHARLLDGGDVPVTTTGRAPLDLVVDALLLARRGDARRALERADAALERAPGWLDARVVALRLRAPLDPRGFLTGARALPADARALVDDLLRPALRAVLVEQVRAAPAAVGRDEARRELEGLAEVAAALGVGLDALQADKVAALEADVAAWAALFRDGLAREAEADALLRCAGVVTAPPRVTPGPGLSAAVDALLDDLHGSWAAAEGRGDRAAAARLVNRILRAEAVAAYELEPGRRPPPWMRTMAERSIFHKESRVDLTIAGLRTGVGHSGRSVTRAADTGELRQLLHARPTSRAVRFALLQRAIHDEPRWSMSLAGAQRVRSHAEAALEPGLLDDLAPCYVGEAWLARATAAAMARPFVADDRELDRVVIESASAAWPLVVLPEHLVQATAYEADTLVAAGALDDALARWDRAVATFRDRLADPHDVVIDNERHCLSRSLTERAKVLERKGRADEAIAAAEAALVEQAQTVAGDDVHPREVLARLLRTRGDLARAREVILGALDEGIGEGDLYPAEAVRILLATGEPSRAREVLERARARWPRSVVLEQVAAELDR